MGQFIIKYKPTVFNVREVGTKVPLTPNETKEVDRFALQKIVLDGEAFVWRGKKQQR